MHKNFQCIHYKKKKKEKYRTIDFSIEKVGLDSKNGINERNSGKLWFFCWATPSTPYEQNTIFFFLQATIFVRRTVQRGKRERSLVDETEEWVEEAVAKGVV